MENYKYKEISKTKVLFCMYIIIIYIYVAALYEYNDNKKNLSLHYFFIHGGLSFDKNEILCDIWYYIVEKNEWYQLHTKNGYFCRYLHSGVFYKDLFILHGGLYPFGLGESVSGITLVLNITQKILKWNRVYIYIIY